VKNYGTNASIPSPPTELDHSALGELQVRLRDAVQQAAGKCARVLLSYIRNNSRLLFANALPPVEAEELRYSLTAYVTTLRLLGEPPERVIIAVKELVREAAADANVDSRGLTSAAVTWAIAGYYMTSESEAGSPPADSVRAGTNAD
jgi:hypothetical protein